MLEQRKHTWCLRVVCALAVAAVTWQGVILLRLQRENKRLAAALTVQYSKPAPAPATNVLEELQKLRRDNEEFNSLRTEAARHRTALEELPSIESEYKRILHDKEAAKLKTAALPDDEFFSLAEENGRMNQCVRNMKQVLLASRIWSNDHGDHMPAQFSLINAEVSDVTLLVCPSDASRRPAAGWTSFGPMNASYEMLSPGVSETDPEIVYIRCPIHGSAGLVDGSVTRLAGTDFRVGLKDGKWRILRSGHD